MYELKLTTETDLPALKNFIDTHWKKNHALVISNKLFNWQHFNEGDNNYNFWIAKPQNSPEIIGILGFIPTSQYDPSLKAQLDIWAAIWKVNDAYPSSTGIGFALLKKILNTDKLHSFSIVGISDIAIEMYKALGFKTGYLNQYYILNQTTSSFKIAHANHEETKKNGIKRHKLQKITSLDNIDLLHWYTPHKSITYLRNRYESHPIYIYTFYGAYKADGQINAIFICRKLKVQSSNCLKIVDIYGDVSTVSCLYQEWQNILALENCEFVDCLNTGIDELNFTKMGFTTLNSNLTSPIIPIYFEPFEQKNIKIGFAIKGPDDFAIFKGDADQDRPNLIENKL